MSANVTDFVKQIYPIPDPTVSEQQADRHANRDLRDETEDVLRRELSVLHLVNFCIDHDWYRDREMAVANELGYRRTRRRLERQA